MDDRNDRDIVRMEGKIEALTGVVNAFQIDMTNQIAELRTLVQNKREMCPFREEISRSSNNRAEIEELEKRVHALEIAGAMASGRAGALGGLAGGSIVGIVIYLIETLGARGL
jgi:archaellum component FlaC